MIRRILSVVIAVVGTALGGLLLTWGGVEYQSIAYAAVEPSSFLMPGVLVALGIVFLAVAVATAALSSAGVIVAGGIHLVIGVVVIPWGPVSIVAALAEPLRAIDPTLFAAVGTWGYSLTPLVLAGLLIAAGLAGSGAPVDPPAGLRLAAALVSGVATLAAAALAGASGDGIALAFVRMQSAGVLEILGAFGALVLAVLAGVAARWDRLGLAAAGTVLTIVGLAINVAPRVINSVVPLAQLPGRSLIGTHFLTALGVSVLVLAIALGLRVRRRRQNDSARFESAESHAQSPQRDSAPSTFPTHIVAGDPRPETGPTATV